MKDLYSDIIENNNNTDAPKNTSSVIVNETLRNSSSLSFNSTAEVFNNLLKNSRTYLNVAGKSSIDKVDI